jgi:hypothetical protein
VVQLLFLSTPIHRRAMAAASNAEAYSPKCLEV